MTDKPAFVISDRVQDAAHVASYRRKRTDPIHRPLRVFALDPAESLRSGAVATIDIPFEPLSPGPCGSLFKVVNRDTTAGVEYRAVDLDSRDVLISRGMRPSVMEPRSHQQMVYAVAMKTYRTFRTALGRELQWGFDRRHDPGRLELHPHHSRMPNGYYDKERGCIHFGYYTASGDETTGRNLPGGTVFTCLSHDIVSHEVTHALLDGLRPHYVVPTNRDVLALHEGVSDLVAVFQKFTYRDVVESAIGQARGALAKAGLLTEVARQFGHTIGRGSALRSAIDTRRTGQDVPSGSTAGDDQATVSEVNYEQGHQGEPHLLGSVLLSAVFDAFHRIFERKSRRYIRLATGGSGVLPPGDLPADLLAALAQLASRLAAQFLSICIRAIDYCPPVDVTFGDYLRALITADYDLVAEDPWGYREAFIDAFRMRKIFPSDVPTLAEESLLWKGIPGSLAACEDLSFAELHFRGDPANSMSAEEQVRRAEILGRLITDPRNAGLFGLYLAPEADGDGDGDGDGDAMVDYDPPCIESLRTSRRIGPDGQILFDLIAEVVQVRRITDRNRHKMPFYGGATIIFEADGQIRYSITKNIRSQRRQKTQIDFVGSDGQALWLSDPTCGTTLPNRCAFQLIHPARR